MLQLTVDPKNIFYRRNTIYNYIECVDALSGEVLVVQEDYNENFILGKMDALVEVTFGDKTILMQKGMSLSEYRPINSKFSKPLADLIVQSVIEGKGITKACKEFGIAYSTITRWAGQNEEFAKELEMARRNRAEVIHDKLMDIASDLETKQMNKTQVEALGRAADILRWSAEKSDSQKFGNKVDKGVSSAVNIIIQTGISREEPVTVEIKEAT